MEMHLLHLEKLGPFPTSEFVTFLEYFGVFPIFDVLRRSMICKFSLTFSFHCYMYSVGDQDFSFQQPADLE